MRNKLLRLAAVYLVPAESIPAESTNEQIAELCASLDPEDHIPGSAAITSEGKPTTSGQVYTSEMSFAIQGSVDAELNSCILTTGAIVCRATNDQVVVLYRNDIFNNTRMRPEINSSGLRSQIKFTITTTKPLI